MLDKEQIILMVQELGEKIGNADLGELFQEDKVQGDKKIGHGQFRELAVLCKAAECFDEIELLVKYNIAKAAEKSKSGQPNAGKSWAKKCRNCDNQMFGELIIGYMEKIRDIEQNVSDVLTDLMYFFGYLYWQSRVWTMENLAHYNNNNGGTFRDDRRRTNTRRN